MDQLEKEWFIEAPWGRISITAWGNCLDTPILMCHGHIDSAASWRPLMKYMPPNFYYIALEWPGNGRSDPYPPGLMINVYDLVYVVRLVVKHFRWQKFGYIAHSLGTLVGKIYNLSYPGAMTLVVDFDPTPTYESIEPEDFANWYHKYFTTYFSNYDKFNASKETAPKYTRDKALNMLKRNRGLTDEAADMVLNRISETLDGELVRFTFDQRSKIITRPPFSSKQREKLFTSIQTPTLTIIAENSLKNGSYDNCKFSLEENTHSSGLYRVRRVEGNHDVHIIHPDRVGGLVREFLVNGVQGLDRKAKL